MKKFSLLFFFSSLATLTFSQTLFTYGTQAVSKEEFLRAYNKNKTSVSNKRTALREYLDLYIKFKLKVKAAHDMGLDTLTSINADLQNFRGQIEESYLNDEKGVNSLVQEALIRSRKDIHIAHLFIPLEKAAKPADTLIIYKAALEACKALTEKKGSLDDIAGELKKKSVSASQADVGFITVFTIPYEFENIVYNLKPGQVSKLYRSKSGYHIFQDIEERNAAGKMKAAQILVAVPAGADEEQKKRALNLADSAYKALVAGADFNEMAKVLSDDKMTFANGGVMPEFGTGKYDPAFESKAFSLQRDGEITTPFQTSFGYHILKRIGRTTGIPDKNNAEYLALLKQQVQQDARISSAKEKLLKHVLKTLGYKKNMGLDENGLWPVTDSFIVSDKKPNADKLNEKTFLHSFNNTRLTVGDWLRFAKNYKTDAGLYKGESYPELMKKYISVTAFEKYREKLEHYNADFKYQLQEFKDGNILFEVMEKNVWSKASNDSTGLLNFYNQHKNKYYWKESADALLISCANDKIAKLVAGEIRNGKSWKVVVDENSSRVQTDSGRYELNQIPVQDRKLTEGTVTDPITNNSDSTASFVKIIHLYPPNQPRNFDESRGLVINDYQNFIEEKWIEQLKKKYPVKINETVFEALLN